jgi:hypothetical protein
MCNAALSTMAYTATDIVLQFKVQPITKNLRVKISFKVGRSVQLH